MRNMPENRISKRKLVEFECALCLQLLDSRHRRLNEDGKEVCAGCYYAEQIIIFDEYTDEEQAYVAQPEVPPAMYADAVQLRLNVYEQAHSCMFPIDHLRE
jgi:hypothetical protein